MKRYILWTRIEVMDVETEEYEDLDPERCEYKVGEFDSVGDVAEFLEECWPANDLEETHAEIQDALKEQGLWEIPE